jgi:AraC-like DNA-binding protein
MVIINNNIQNNYHLSFYKKYYKICEIRFKYILKGKKIELSLEGKIIREISKVVHMSFKYVSRIIKNTLEKY